MIVFVCQEKGRTVNENDFQASFEYLFVRKFMGPITFHSFSLKLFLLKFIWKWLREKFQLIIFYNSFLSKLEYLRIYNSKNWLVIRHFILILTINELVIYWIYMTLVFFFFYILCSFVMSIYFLNNLHKHNIYIYIVKECD